MPCVKLGMSTTTPTRRTAARRQAIGQVPPDSQVQYAPRPRPIKAIPVTGHGDKPGIYAPTNVPNYGQFYTHDSPLWQRLRAQNMGKFNRYGSVLRNADYYPYNYPFGYSVDPTFWLYSKAWGAGYLYFKPFYAEGSGACVQGDRCIDGTSALACPNWDSSKANAFYTGKSCQELAWILGPNFLAADDNKTHAAWEAAVNRREPNLPPGTWPEEQVGIVRNAGRPY